jgi:NAD(P)-dependent dehydrogenase (short-subunit alcohol dehydrogenase family)
MPTRSTSFAANGVAVVTGAGSGIGRALARQLAVTGCALALADIDEAGLQQTATSLNERGAPLSTHLVDVSDERAVQTFAQEVMNKHGRLTLLINNAGVALHGRFDEISLDDLRWLMQINFWGVVHGVKFFLPLLKQQPRAHIVNMSSVFGIVAPPGQSAYSASKFAVRGFTEALRHELEGSSVFVSCVHPGGIRTPIARRARLGANTPPSSRDEAVARFDRLTPTMPDAAAARILQGIERREPRILVGRDAWQIDLFQRLRPGTYWKAMARRMQEPAR